MLQERQRDLFSAERSDFSAPENRDFFLTEGYEYFLRNYEGVDLRTLPMIHFLRDLLTETSLDLAGKSILEVGCGAANNLHHLVERLGAGRGVGTEPSPETVAVLDQAYPEFEFVESFGHRLPFESGEFDLVLIRSVLSWVHPDYLWQTIGEVLRVSSRYLIISDFGPVEPYSVAYRDHPYFRTCKMSYVPFLEASGFVEAQKVIVDDADSDWTRIETVLFEKKAVDAAFPLLTDHDFQ